MRPTNSPSEIAMNMPNNSLMYQSFTPMFGNMMFQIAPSQTGEINYSYGTTSELSLEALLYQQQIASQTQPTQIAPGQHTGQHNISGQYTVTGPAGNVQAAIGSATTTSGHF
jgi:hypothetical protein